MPHTLFNADCSEPVQIVIRKQCEAECLLERLSIRTVQFVKKALNLAQRQLMMIFQDLDMEPPLKRRHCLLTEVLNMEAGLKIRIFQ